MALLIYMKNMMMMIIIIIIIVIIKLRTLAYIGYTRCQTVIKRIKLAGKHTQI